MTINLSGYSNVQAGLFVTINVDDTNIFRFSDYNTTITIGGYSYQGLGKMVSITQSTSELRTTPGSISITMTGVPSSSITDVTSLGMKGAKVIVLRGFFDAVTGTILSIAGNPVGRFYGIVNNYTLNEELDMTARTSITTITLTCSSIVELLENKIAGRKTNPSSMKNYYPTDVSMDRVPALVGANFDFGVPK